MFDVDVIHCIL